MRVGPRGPALLRVTALRRAIEAAGASLYVIAPTGGSVAAKGGAVPVDRTAMTTQSVEYDALVLACGKSAAALGATTHTQVNLSEAFRHHKVVAAWGEGQGVLDALGITGDVPGVVVGSKVDQAFGRRLVEATGWHRHWDRAPIA